MSSDQILASFQCNDQVETSKQEVSEAQTPQGGPSSVKEVCMGKYWRAKCEWEEGARSNCRLKQKHSENTGHL